MEKTSILDFVNRISELSKQTKENGKNKSTENNADLPPTSETTAEKTSESKNLSLKQTDNSFMKTYNPFGEIQKGRPQLNMPKAPKPVKNKIDLTSSKKSEIVPQSEGAKNMLELIKRHNEFAEKIKRS